MSHIVVLGAGPTGLMAARDAVLAGHSCTVLEATDQVGGMAGSFEVAGQRVDFGSHRLHPATPPRMLALIGELLGTDLQVRPRAGRLRLADRWVSFPLRAGELLKALPPSLTARLMADSMVSSVRGLTRPPSTYSFADEVTARLGPTVTDQFYGPYARKLYGVEPDDLSRELAERRISAGSPTDIARRLLTATRPAGRTFLYPRFGYGQIGERLAEEAITKGATIRLGEPVTMVRATGDDATVETGVRSEQADLVLSTIPLPRLAALLKPSPPQSALQALGRLKTRGMLLAYLVIDRPKYSGFDAHYIPGPETVVARLSEPKNYRDGPDPPDRTVLCAEIPCWADDELRRWSAQRLAGVIAEDLVGLGLPPLSLLHAETRYLESVYPVYEIATANARGQVERWSRQLGPIVPLGRQGFGVIDNLHHVLEMGSAAVAAIRPDGSMDETLWSASLERFATNTVED